MRTLAHLSDLHLGRSQATLEAAIGLRDALDEGAVDHVVVTGDVTHRGRRGELDLFFDLFGRLIEAGRLSVVPGNHDRLGDDCGQRLMRGDRVEVARADGLYLVRVDSTGPHNRFLLAGHGDLCTRVLQLIDRALDGAQPGELVVLAMHHHLLPAPEEMLSEVVANWLGLPSARELELGRALLERVRGRCDLVLHGHRHVPRSHSFFTDGPRPLGLYNAGSTTEIGRMRLFTHARGRLDGPPEWMFALPAQPALLEEIA
jgi:3',5'-cyclic AMP phosphodiesterase CpdA